MRLMKGAKELTQIENKLTVRRECSTTETTIPNLKERSYFNYKVTFLV